MKLRCLVVIALLFSGAAYAEQGCPDGLYPGGAAPGQICIPMPGYGISSGSSGSQVESGPSWATRWGAIAIDDGTNGGSKMGKAEAFSSKGKAERAALADCRSKGGHKCTLEHAYHDQCVAVAWGDSLVSTMSAENSERASQLAIEKCSDSTTNCGIYYTGCSYPERVQ